MTLKVLLTDLSKPLHQEVYDKVAQLEQDLSKAIDSNSQTHTELSRLREELIEARKTKPEVKTPIDEFLLRVGTVVSNKAYRNKRSKGSQTLWLNQMITPQAWEVQNFAQKHVKHSMNLWNQMQILGDALAKHTTWVSEQKLYDTGDYYLYPEETLTTHKAKADCEDMSFTMSSFAPEFMGVCYGFFINGKEKFGHAYPVFLYSGKLYIVETTGDAVEITGFEDGRYETYFIITQKHTYKFKEGVEFGVLASWE